MTLYEEVRAALRDSDLRPRKSRGQNFLIHERVIDAILRLLEISSDDQVVEIGPGLGFLTRRLLERAGAVWAIEVDSVLVDRLRRSVWAANPKFHLVHGDFLEFSPVGALPVGPIKLAGNLPYSVATEMLFHIFAQRERISLLVLMLQKEVADRIAAKPGTKDYGALSIWCQIHGRITDKVSVSPEAFFPRPKVRSTLLKFELFAAPLIGADDALALRDLVRAAFGQRRKTLGNALAAYSKRQRSVIDDWLRSQEIDPNRRGETLSIDEFIRLAGASRGMIPDSAVEHKRTRRNLE